MSTRRVLEIRTYRLKPGTGGTFHSLVSERSVPLLRAAGTDVVSYGQSLHAPDEYFLMRAYSSLEDLRDQQDSFYASSAWRQGPREEIVKLIEVDANATMWLTAQAIEALREGHSNG